MSLAEIGGARIDDVLLGEEVRARGGHHAGYYRCKRCRVEAVARRRRKVKEVLVLEEDGGRWRLCGV
jgi:hypothetical protein